MAPRTAAPAPAAWPAAEPSRTPTEWAPPPPPAEAPATATSARDVAPVFEVTDVATAEAVVERLMAMPADWVHACDTEVADLDISKSPIGQGRVTCVSIYSGPEADYGRGKGYALWVDTTDEAVLMALKPFLEAEDRLKVWHNYGFDRHVIWNHGVDVRGLGGDTMHLARLWDAARKTGCALLSPLASRLTTLPSSLFIFIRLTHACMHARDAQTPSRRSPTSSSSGARSQ